MSIATVVTRGYGSFGTIGQVVTRGFNIAVVVLLPKQPLSGASIEASKKNRSIHRKEYNRTILKPMFNRSVKK